jgi:hypothetical protein
MSANIGGSLIVLIIGGGFALVLGGIGVVLLVLYSRNKTKAGESQKWPNVMGHIVGWDIKTDYYDDEDFSKLSYLPKITYLYQVNGETYEGHRFAFGSDPSFTQKSKAEAFLAQYSSKTEFPVYYNPEKPSESVLSQQLRSMKAGLIVGIVLIVLMICFLCPIGIGFSNILQSM